MLYQVTTITRLVAAAIGLSMTRRRPCLYMSSTMPLCAKRSQWGVDGDRGFVPAARNTPIGCAAPREIKKGILYLTLHAILRGGFAPPV